MHIYDMVILSVCLSVRLSVTLVRNVEAAELGGLRCLATATRW